jgi:hypothetical protein
LNPYNASSNEDSKTSLIPEPFSEKSPHSHTIYAPEKGKKKGAKDG